MDRLAQIIIATFLVAGLILLTFQSFPLTGHIIKAEYSKEKLQSFVSCLSEKTTVYLNQDCPDLSRQKSAFQETFSMLKTIDCTQNSALCQKNRGTCIVWDINARQYQGFQPLQKLSLLTQCPL